MNTEKIIETFKNYKKITPKSVKKYCNENKNDAIEIDKFLEENPEWETKQNVIAGIAKGIVLQKCKICGKTLKFSRLTATYCSNICKNSDKDLFAKIKETNLKKFGVDNPAKASIIKEKIKQTNLERFGTENAAQSEIVREKIRQTNLKRFGTEYAFQNEEVKNKIQQIFDEKYGGNPNKCKEVRTKIENTCKEKYGSECAFGNAEVNKKAVKTRMENGSTKNQLQGSSNLNSAEAKVNRINAFINKFGVDNPLKVPEIKEKAKQTNIRKFGNEYPCADPNVVKKMSDSRHKTTFERNLIRFSGIVEPMFTIDEFIGSGYDKIYRWKCCNCGNVFEDHCYSHIPRCMNCNPYLNGFSYMENDLNDFIRLYFPNAHKDKKIIYPKELDIVIDELKLAIEFNGKYWHSIERHKDNGYHLNKTLQCNEKGYRLIHIWESKWIDDKEAIKTRLEKIFKGEEDLNFTNDIIKLDRSWYNYISIPGYELIEEEAPTVENMHEYLVENCGYLIYKRI